MRSTGARLWSTADCINNHRVVWGNRTATQALYKHGICQTAWWQENHSCTSAVFHRENQNHKSFQRRIALKTCVSIPKAIDTSIAVIFFYYLIYFYRTSYDNVVSPSPHHTPTLTLWDISHVKMFSSEAGTTFSLCEGIKLMYLNTK